MTARNRFARNIRVTATRVTRSLRAALQAEAHPRNGADEPLSRAVVAELPTETVRGDAHHLARGLVVEAPDVLRDRACRNDRVAPAHEVLEETELRRSEPRGDPVVLQGALCRVETERADDECVHRLLGPVHPRAPRVRTDAREDLAMPERLHHVVVGAHVQGTHLVVLAVAP